MPSLAESKSKHNLKKPMPQNLVPARTISMELMPQKPFPTEEVAEQTTSAEVTLPIATDSSDDDLMQQSFHGEPLTHSKLHHK
jgi:hypothetical protein